MRDPKEIVINGVSLAEILERHLHWIREDCEGWENMRADLSGANLFRADLSEADLSGANLLRADLSEADLSGANLFRANLSEADLSGADLSGANLFRANLSGANLFRANLSEADLSGANLSGANLRGANLSGADLSGADLSRANLSGADLSGAYLSRAENVPFIPMACPDTGSFIGWKKSVEGRIVQLEIPADAKRSSAAGRKCRCDKAKVISITNIEGDKNFAEAYSWNDSNFVYKVGEMVSVEDFCEDRFRECAPGIHFFVNRQEAVNYDFC